MSSNIFNKFSSTLFPSFRRSYYQISEVDPQTLTKIKEIYSKALNIPADQVVIFAITDADQGKTFLLPDFYKLNPFQKDQILFHEWLWVLNPDASYGDVMFGEKLFYQFMQDPEGNYFDLTLDLARFLNTPQVIVAPVFNRVLPTSKTASQLFDQTLWNCGNLVESSAISDLRAQCVSDWQSRVTTVANKNILQKMITQFVNLGGGFLDFRWMSPGHFVNTDYELKFQDGPVPSLLIMPVGSSLPIAIVDFR